MTPPVLYTLRRHHDVSGVSGTGDVATIVEFSSGMTVLHWESDTPSIQVHPDFRQIEHLHGHGGASTVELNDTARLLGAYQAVVPMMLNCDPQQMPLTVSPHPDHPDRLRLVFSSRTDWAVWVQGIAGFPNAVHAAVQEEKDGEVEHRWTTPSGDIWCVFYSPLTDENPLQRFHQEDR